MQFWISLTDAKGASWAFGPLHSGGNGPTDCLHLAGDSLMCVKTLVFSVFTHDVAFVRVQPNVSAPHNVSVGATVGIAIGALVFGVIFTLLLQWLWGYRRRYYKTNETDNEVEPTMQATPFQSGIEPYPIAAIRAQELAEAGSNEENPVMTERNNDSQVYVVHHDAGGAPVTIFTAGRDVQELPPHYTMTSSSEPQTSNTPSTSLDSSGRSNETRRAKTTVRAVTN